MCLHQAHTAEPRSETLVTAAFSLWRGGNHVSVNADLEWEDKECSASAIIVSRSCGRDGFRTPFAAWPPEEGHFCPADANLWYHGTKHALHPWPGRRIESWASAKANASGGAGANANASASAITKHHYYGPSLGGGPVWLVTASEEHSASVACLHGCPTSNEAGWNMAPPMSV